MARCNRSGARPHRRAAGRRVRTNDPGACDDIFFSGEDISSFSGPPASRLDHGQDPRLDRCRQERPRVNDRLQLRVGSGFHCWRFAGMFAANPVFSGVFGVCRRFAKPPFVGSTPTGASCFFRRFPFPPRPAACGPILAKSRNAKTLGTLSWSWVVSPLPVLSSSGRSPRSAASCTDLRLHCPRICPQDFVSITPSVPVAAIASGVAVISGGVVRSGKASRAAVRSCNRAWE